MRPGFALGNDFFRTSQDLLNGEFLLLKTAEQTMNLRQEMPLVLLNLQNGSVDL